MRCEHLGLTGTVACLHHQQPVGRSSIIICLHSCAPPAAVLLPSSNPPHVVLQGKTVAIWATIQHRDTSLSSRWRNDAPQEICTLQHNSLYDAQSTRLIFCHLFKGLTYSFESPFRGPYFDLDDAFISSSWECNQCPHNTLLVPCVLWQVTHAAIGLVSLPVFLFGILHKLFRSRSFKRKVLPHIP